MATYQETQDFIRAVEEAGVVFSGYGEEVSPRQRGQIHFMGHGDEHRVILEVMKRLGVRGTAHVLTYLGVVSVVLE